MICKTSTQRAQTSANVVQCSPIAHSPDLESIMIGSRSPTNVFVLLRAGCVCDNLLDHVQHIHSCWHCDDCMLFFFSTKPYNCKRLSIFVRIPSNCAIGIVLYWHGYWEVETERGYSVEACIYACPLTSAIFQSQVCQLHQLPCATSESTNVHITTLR